MKNLLITMILLSLTYTPVLAEEINKKIVDHLQEVSVTVETSRGSGSGVLKVRKMNDHNITLCFTAAHVVDGLRKEREIIDVKSGSKKTKVEFDDAKVVKVLVENGRTVGKVEVFAKVFKYDAEEDFAILQVRKNNFTNDSVKFYLEKDPPGLATPLIHVGSFLGEGGSASISVGIISQHGRLIDGKVFDQMTATSFPGSSGGGVFLHDGRMIGQVLRGAGEGFVLIGPTRRLVDWAKRSKIEWAIDDSVEMPSQKELEQIPVE